MPAKIHGRLGGIAVPNADTTVYTVPNNRKATVTASLCNRSTDTTGRIALVDSGGGPGNDDYLVYDAPIGAGGLLQQERITLAANQSIVMRCAGGSGTGLVWGVEEDA